MNFPIEIGQSADIQVPDEAAPWRADRLEDCVVIATSEIVVDTTDTVAAMRGCLVANVCTELSASARFIARDGGELCLETSIAPLQSDAGIACLKVLKQNCLAAVGSMELPGAAQIEQELEQAHADDDADSQVLELLHVLEGKASPDPELSALLSIDEVQGAGTFEPDDESWVIAIGPSFIAGHLSLTVGLAPLDDGDEAKTLLLRGLELGSARVVGPSFRIGCDPMAETLLLCTDLAPHLVDVDAIKEAIGGLLLLAERLEPRLFAQTDEVLRPAMTSLQPNLADSLSTYLLIRP
jgi:hypothetical protein